MGCECQIYSRRLPYILQPESYTRGLQRVADRVKDNSVLIIDD